MRVKALSPTATCPKCGSKETKRTGSDLEARVGKWACKECGHEFVVPTLVLFKPRT